MPQRKAVIDSPSFSWAFPRLNEPVRERSDSGSGFSGKMAALSFAAGYPGCSFGLSNSIKKSRYAHISLYNYK
jgi:hypothetical protein